jgi:SAM-dependent methyltransferase
MTDDPAACRLCGGTPIANLGVIPDSDYFAGRVLPQALRGGSLWRCSTCQSMFRHPILPPSAYLAMYAQGIAEAWSSDADRLDLKIVRGLIAQKGASGRVLDVGCGSGGFLRTLPASLERYGIEPSVAAAASAAGSGISILGRTLQDLPPGSRFDVVTVIDVIEHVADPAGLLDEILAHLAPAGCLIVSTGDPGHALWRRIFRARFWYSSFPEHISFPSRQFFAHWQHSRDLPPLVRVRTPYRALPWWRLPWAYLAQAAYLLSPACINFVGRGLQWLCRAPRPRRRFFSGGGLGAFADHQVVLIRQHYSIPSFLTR